MHESAGGTVQSVDKAGSGQVAVASTTPALSAASAEQTGQSLARASR